MVTGDDGGGDDGGESFVTSTGESNLPEKYSSQNIINLENF